MPRATIIFGNGLGMALDSDYFQINKGLEDAWNQGGQLSDGHKALIISAIKGTSIDNPPKSEEQLDQLQVALFAADFLKSISDEENSWLNDAAQSLPSAFRQYLHDTAIYFSQSNLKLPDQFVRCLTEYIFLNKSHVATLNYDNLLYDTFIETKITQGFDGSLIDGFFLGGFSPENLDRKKPKNLGWYMHLHGSPLFVGNSKAMREDRKFLKADDKTHIVLTHIEHKPTIISASKILTEYWKRLDKAIDESDAIILFGYSGIDEHLNKKIQARSDDKIERPLWIIEWKGAGSEGERTKFWKEKTKFEHINLIRMANILEFTDWDRCHTNPANPPPFS